MVEVMVTDLPTKLLVNKKILNLFHTIFFSKYTLCSLGGIGGVPNYPRNPLNELGNYPGVYPGGPPGGSVAGGNPTGYGSGSNWYGSQSGIRPGFTSVNSNYSRDHGFICPAQFRVPKGLDYVVRVGGKVYPDCGAPCKGMFFNEGEVRFSRLWILVWGVICMASCLFTVMTNLFHFLWMRVNYSKLFFVPPY